MKFRIKEILKERGETMEELAKKLQINRVTLTRNLAGNPTVETLKKIADALSVRFIDLFYNDGVSGFIKIHGQVHEINSIKDLKHIIELYS
ncbi:MULTISPECIES: helix-turn-helix transcriptional regulator [Apibacter]|uniref:helix-turn-helix transcriptional regulator n=1 Tax=Apibacter TaxID=1778601 RepID=UPI00135DB5FE|nr:MULTISPECIES: helix-turn-helix transcriptional regulator [Apibacter]MXP04794.1 helix-turn-helix domain-containing protein [Apibacter sp. B3546]MXP13119.1 helix-turn-helix domain-containing protein [Apibacter sp. B3239]